MLPDVPELDADRRLQPAPASVVRSSASSDDQCFADGISRQEIVPAFFQPSLSNHVLG